MYDKIAVIGDENSIFAFKSVGVDVFGTENEFEARDYVKKLARERYGVIFITEDIAERLDDLLAKYKNKTYPAIIPIPKSGKSSGYSMQGLKRDMEKAIGTDILFRDNK